MRSVSVHNLCPSIRATKWQCIDRAGYLKPPSFHWPKPNSYSACRRIVVPDTGPHCVCVCVYVYASVVSAAIRHCHFSLRPSHLNRDFNSIQCYSITVSRYAARMNCAHIYFIISALASGLAVWSRINHEWVFLDCAVFLYMCAVQKCVCVRALLFTVYESTFRPHL